MMTGAAGFKELQEGNTNTEQDFEAQWQIEETNMGNIDQLKWAIEQGRAIVVSNGSFMEQSGAAAWTIEGTTDQQSIVGTGITPGA